MFHALYPSSTFKSAYNAIIWPKFFFPPFLLFVLFIAIYYIKMSWIKSLSLFTSPYTKWDLYAEYFYPLLVWPDMWLKNLKRPTCPVHFHGCHSHPGMSGEVFHLDVLFQKSFNLTLIFDTRQCGRIAITITLQKYDHKGPWWWSSGQHAHLRWSEFEARWCLHIFLQNLCLKRTKINKKRSVLAHFWKKYDDKDQTDHGGVLAVTMLALYSDIQVRIP